MSETLATIIGLFFVFITVYLFWLKFHEHLHQHRHEHGPHTHRTDLTHTPYYLSDSGMMRRKRRSDS
jgi:hypothetical protein